MNFKIGLSEILYMLVLQNELFQDRRLYSHFHAKHHFDVFGVCRRVGFEKTHVAFYCGKILKQQNRTWAHNISSTLPLKTKNVDIIMMK